MCFLNEQKVLCFGSPPHKEKVLMCVLCTIILNSQSAY